jgi:hypothetical protein
VLSEPEVKAKLQAAFGGFAGPQGRYHAYELDGKPIPSVTAATGKLDKSAALLGWAAKLAADTGNPWEYRDARKKAADLGTEAHALIEHELRKMLGIEDFPPDVSDDAHYVVAGWREWAQGVKLVPLAVEMPIFCRSLWYAGKPDVIAFVRGTLCVPDWKSSKNGAVYDEMRLQNYAYRHAIAEVVGEMPDGMVVLLPKESIAKGAKLSGITPVDIPWSDEGFEAFKGLLATYKWCQISAKEEKARTR